MEGNDLIALLHHIYYILSGRCFRRGADSCLRCLSAKFVMIYTRKRIILVFAEWLHHLRHGIEGSHAHQHILRGFISPQNLNVKYFIKAMILSSAVLRGCSSFVGSGSGERCRVRNDIVIYRKLIVKHERSNFD